jgi:hypothetical protein
LGGFTWYRWPLLFCPGSLFRSRISLGDGTGNGPMISLRPSLITAHHCVSSLSGPAREASPCSRYLRPARDVDTTCTVRLMFTTRWRQRSERIEPRTYFADASVDPTEARKHVRTPVTTLSWEPRGQGTQDFAPATRRSRRAATPRIASGGGAVPRGVESRAATIAARTRRPLSSLALREPGR